MSTTTAVHPLPARALLVLSAVLACSGCNAREYVHWEPDISAAALRADSLPDDRAARVQLVNGRVFEARNISFEGETLSWTEPGSGVVSSLLLSQVDSVRVQGERRIGTGALIGALPGVAAVAYWLFPCLLDGDLCSADGGFHWKVSVALGGSISAIGAGVGAILGSARYNGVTFVR